MRRSSRKCGALSLVLYAAMASSVQAQSTLPDGEGKTLVLRVCTGCHGIENITGFRISKERWSKEVDDMVARGAEGTDQELDQIVEYLAKNFGPASKTADAQRINVNKASASELAAALALPDEAASAIVEYRRKNGNFKQWQDLKNVPGLDMKQIEDKKGRLEF